MHPAGHHHLAPVVRGQIAGVHDPFVGQDLKDGDVVHAGLYRIQPVKHRKVAGIGGDHLVVGVENGKPVSDRLNRVPQTAFRHLDLLIGLAQFAAHAFVFGAHIGHFGPRLDDFALQRGRMSAQLAVSRRQFGLLQLQKPLRREPPAPFFGQLVCQAHDPLRQFT